MDNQNFQILLNDKCIERKFSVKYLGLIISYNLSWDEYINNINKKCARHIGVLGKLRHYLPFSLLKVYYFANIQSLLLYGITIWCSTYNSQTMSLEVLIRRSIRTMLCLDNDTNVDNVMINSNVRTLNVLWLQTTAKTMYKIINKHYHNSIDFNVILLTNLDRRNLRSNSLINNVVINQYNTNSGKFSFKNVSARSWNYINKTYSTNISFSLFKYKLKTINWSNFTL